MEILRPGVQGTSEREGDPWRLGLCRESCLGEPNPHLDLDAEGGVETGRKRAGLRGACECVLGASEQRWAGRGRGRGCSWRSAGWEGQERDGKDHGLRSQPTPGSNLSSATGLLS